MGQLERAPIVFEAAHDVPHGGLLLAVPALLSTGLLGSSGESVGKLRVSARGLSEETVKLAAGRVKGALLVFPAVVDQRSTVLMDHVADKLPRGALS